MSHKKINTEKGNVALVCSDCIDNQIKEFQKRTHRIEPGAYLKHRFVSHDGTTESMWVKITQVIDKNVVYGTLSNEPVYLHEYQYGANVKVELDKCLDYIPKNE